MSIKTFTSLLVALLAVAGCSKPSKGGDNPTPTPDPDPTPTSPYFKATIKDSYLQGPDDTGISIMLDTNMSESEWTVETDADWIVVTTSARSAGDKTKRTATVKLVSDRDSQTYRDITISDAESNLNGEDYNYGDHTDWD